MKNALSAVALLLCACGDPSASVGGDETTTTSTNALAAEATLQFNADWSVRQSAALVKGGTLRLEYNAQRIQQCLGDNAGQPAWTATAHVIVGNAPEQLVWVGGASSNGATSIVNLDREGDLTIWFEVTNRWGCQWFDSNFGDNFHFAISTAVPVHFNADWTITTDGALSTAKVLSVDYALARLPSCRAQYRGFAAWDILAYARFDDGAVLSSVVTRALGSDRVPAPAAFAVPPGASKVQLWFFNSDEFGCHAYDSNYGQNYTLTVR